MSYHNNDRRTDGTAHASESLAVFAPTGWHSLASRLTYDQLRFHVRACHPHAPIAPNWTPAFRWCGICRLRALRYADTARADHLRRMPP